MTVRLLRASAHRRMPWKNGGGETVEIIVSPEAAGLDNFDWRVSMARVATDGPFSRFAGIDRTLSLVEGEGIALRFSGGPEAVLTEQSQPFGFSGDLAVDARLLGGAILDLNVMTRRGAWRHRVARLRLTDQRVRNCAGDVTVILSRSRDLRLSAGTEGCVLGTDDAAIVDGPAHLALEPSGEAALFVIELSRA